MTWRSLGTGSISCLGITAEDGAAAEARRQPIGFHSIVHEVARDALAEESRRREALVEQALADAGECGWTARDTFEIRTYVDGRFEVV
jgi:hypothetical protein